MCERVTRQLRLGASGKFPNMTEPDPSYNGLPYWPGLGHGCHIIKARVQMLRDFGSCISPPGDTSRIYDAQPAKRSGAGVDRCLPRPCAPLGRIESIEDIITDLDKGFTAAS